MFCFFPLAEYHLCSVYQAVSSLASEWRQFGLNLGLACSEMDAIQHNHPNDVKGCLMQSLYEWLRGKFESEKYNHPSWKHLIDTVSDINPALADDLASKHTGMFMYLVGR